MPSPGYALAFKLSTVLQVVQALILLVVYLVIVHLLKSSRAPPKVAEVFAYTYFGRAPPICPAVKHLLN